MGLNQIGLYLKTAGQVQRNMEIFEYKSYQEYLDEQMKASEDLKDRENVETHVSALNAIKEKLLYGVFTKVETTNILCVGARNCNEILAFKKVFAGSNMNITAIDLTSHKLNECDIIGMDMHNMTVKRNSYDIIYAHHVLEHSPMPDMVAGEMVRAIKNDGIIYLIVPILYQPTPIDCVAFRCYYDIHDLFKHRVIETIYSKTIKAPEGSNEPNEIRLAFRIKKLE